jgi:hypothetical protein
MRYNLKISVSFLIVTLAVAPFVYFHFRAEDVVQYFDQRYQILDALVACALTLPILLLIGFNPAFARMCAKDVSRVDETISTARYTSVLVTLMLLVSFVAWVF